MPSNFRKFTRSLHSMQAELLDNRHFMATLCFAFFLHVTALLIYAISPSAETLDIPVRALNIRLGDGDEMTREEMEAIQPNAANQQRVEQVLTKLAKLQETSAAAKPTEIPNTPSAMSASRTDVVVPYNVPKQYIRATSPKVEGDNDGTMKRSEIVARYEQIISLWIQKFKQYPEEARDQQLTGGTIIRIRIDRRGNIGYYALETTTGSPMLDRAAIDMIRRANPVPAVPDDYPPGDLLEFLIPVNFQLQ
ncbi:MAG: TonB family protein [Rickettsiales bacterium]|nr:TonB family protein [Rickettsiales bacterium]